MITIFKKINNPRPWYDREPNQVLEAISGKSKHIEIVKQARDSVEEYKKLKESLPCVTWSGSFSYRNSYSIKELSGLMYFDIDNQDPTLLKEQLKQLDYVYAVWNSVSNWGIGFLIKVEGLTIAKYKPTYLAIRERLVNEGIIIDKLSDITRLNVLSYDPNIYINENSVLIDSVEPIVHPPVNVFNTIKDVSEATEIALKSTNKKGLRFEQGMRHHFTVCYFGTCNAFGIPLEEAYNHAVTNGCSSNVTYKKAKDIYDRYSSEFNSINIYNDK